ncbi:glycosyltransferase family 2 protein [Actibacterium ureilyticum]|uniref:glycosyltransferase family 2 protein n=1 Tax=Actibacterium ureilyticum TaxID=1590614 RepID=UPI000BAB0883|nr:glycosyltransferase family A protein [Actibacterium ureilyticum]
MPTFSIIIPCYNAERTIDSTLSCLQAQTCTDWEAICIDDGSTDRTKQRIRDVAARDSRITLCTHPRKGPSAARNHGAMKQARGDFLTFCDADDLWVPSKLAELSQVFAQGDVDGAFGEVGFFSDRPGDTSVRSTVEKGLLDVQTLLGENPVCTMSNMAVRRDLFVASGGFDETMVHNEDLDWLIRLVAGGARVAGVPRLQTYYRLSVHGLSADLDAMEHGRRQALASAARLGIRPSAVAHATYKRYLARRALRLGQGRTAALKYALAGVLHSPGGFVFPLRRGLPTLCAAVCALAMPPRLTRRLFA